MNVNLLHIYTEHFSHFRLQKSNSCSSILGPPFWWGCMASQLAIQPTQKRTFITLPTGAEVLTQAFSPARCLRDDRRQRSGLFKAEGRHYLAKNISGLMLVSPSAPVERVIKVRPLEQVSAGFSFVWNVNLCHVQLSRHFGAPYFCFPFCFAGPFSISPSLPDSRKESAG